MASRPPIPDFSRTSSQREIARIAEMRNVHAAFTYLHNQEMEFRRWQRELTEIPSPPFGEAARSEWLRQRFTKLGLENVQVDELGNVIGLLSREPAAPLIGVSAHLDTVFPHGTALKTREEGSRLFGPGISDNAAGVTALLAMATVLKRAGLKLPTNIAFIGNVGEEGEGNLRGMRHLFLTGRGSSLSAVGTGALIVKEAARMHAEGMSSAAFRHGPIEMLRADMLICVYRGDDRTGDLNHRLARDLLARGAHCYEIGTEASLPAFRLAQCTPSLRPILEILPVQMMTLALASLAGREAGHFEQATKITGTE
jgi:hypothetical protein